MQIRDLGCTGGFGIVMKRHLDRILWLDRKSNSHFRNRQFGFSYDTSISRLQHPWCNSIQIEINTNTSQYADNACVISNQTRQKVTLRVDILIEIWHVAPTKSRLYGKFSYRRPAIVFVNLFIVLSTTKNRDVWKHCWKPQLFPRLDNWIKCFRADFLAFPFNLCSVPVKAGYA